MTEKQNGKPPAPTNHPGGGEIQSTPKAARGPMRTRLFVIAALCTTFGIGAYLWNRSHAPTTIATLPVAQPEAQHEATPKSVGTATAPAHERKREIASVAPAQTTLTTPSGKSAKEVETKSTPNTAPAPQAAMIPKGCFEETFTHKPVSSHADGEACLQHQNLVTLSLSGEALAAAMEHPGKFQTSLCVRVNGKPVKFKMNPTKPSEVMIPALAGPESTIRVRYCTGNATCSGKQSGCTVPKDDFLASLGAAGGIGEDFDDLTAAAPNEAWGEGKHSKQDKQTQANIDRQLASAKKVFEAARKGKTKIFKDWLAQGSAEPACQFQTALQKPSHTGTKE